MIAGRAPLLAASLWRARLGPRLLAPPSLRNAKATRRTVAVAAVISKEEETGGSIRLEVEEESSLEKGAEVSVRAVVTVRKKRNDVGLMEKAEEQVELFLNGIGQGIVIQLISEDLDPVTNAGKRSVEAQVRGWLPKPSNRPLLREYTADLTVPAGFGRPGAVLVTNLHRKEFHLEEVVIHGFADGPFFFPANTWIHSCHDDPESRIVFRNQAYLPSQTPPGIEEARKRDLKSLRGDGKGERKKFDRVYDYATYNDLGNPDKDPHLARPVLGGARRPYPRRCRTGRPPSKRDPSTESRIEKPNHVYVPRDETFEDIKQAAFSAGTLRAVLHTLIPSLGAALSKSDSHFENFSDIDDLYKQGTVFVHEDHKAFQGLLLARLITTVNKVREKLLKYEMPSIISRDRFAWLRDSEFARQILAGMNAMSIERLREFPIKSKLDPAIYGPPESALTKGIIESKLDNTTLEEAMEQGRLFILDYHDILLPFIEKVNALEDRKAYASRTLFYLTELNVLKPIAIELSLPPTPSSSQRKRVFTNGHDATSHWIWKLAKAHVCANDAGIHQLVNHWLRTHACMETYVLSAHRNLSAMHPIFKLLHPHLRYTLEINALARQSLINGGGIIEDCFSPGRYSMEVSAAAYDLMWRFDMEALPLDLVRRGMAVEDPSQPCGVKLLFEDYPYAADGLLIWSAIREWVHSYVSHFYEDADSVKSDVELQSWWDEIKNKGHRDKRSEPWWPSLKTKDDLVGILTTMIWVASGHHAAVNFGQYPFGGYMPNRPAMMKKLIPEEDDPEYDAFLLDPEYAFLSSLPTQLQAMKIMAVQDTLSTHSPDEEYLGQVVDSHRNWINDPKILTYYDKFSARLKEIEVTIHKRNKDKRLKNRTGAGVPPYELLIPSSGPGVTGRGIPNSISI